MNTIDEDIKRRWPMAFTDYLISIFTLGTLTTERELARRREISKVYGWPPVGPWPRTDGVTMPPGFRFNKIVDPGPNGIIIDGLTSSNGQGCVRGGHTPFDSAFDIELPKGIPRQPSMDEPRGTMMRHYTPLTFQALMEANRLRIPQFRDKHGRICHEKEDGSDWSPSQWLQAVIGELGEYANERKKFERGDLTLEEFRVKAGKELADVQIYLSILAMRCLDSPGVPTIAGIDLGGAVIDKFNEVSKRVGSNVRLAINRVYIEPTLK